MYIKEKHLTMTYFLCLRVVWTLCTLVLVSLNINYVTACLQICYVFMNMLWLSGTGTRKKRNSGTQTKKSKKKIQQRPQSVANLVANTWHYLRPQSVADAVADAITRQMHTWTYLRPHSVAHRSLDLVAKMLTCYRPICDRMRSQIAVAVRAVADSGRRWVTCD